MADSKWPTRESNVDAVQVVKVIRVDSVTGRGTENDPVRRVTEYYTMEGRLITRSSPWEDSNARKE